MEFIGHFRRLTPVQRNTFIACFLGWSLDAFDFFILNFCISAIATQFQAKVSAVAEAIFLTLAMRPVGAFLFGLMADRFGRRITLMVDIIAYSVFELSSAFAPSLKTLLIMRALFGVAMGGEWGVGAALAFETLPAEGRGFFSGVLQEGYAVGYLMAALVYGTVFRFVGWRGMFVIGALPAFLVIYIRTKVDESPAWAQGRVSRKAENRLGKDVLTYLGTFAFLVVLMFAFNSFSHGSQDLYPSFLVIPLWAYSHTVPMLALGGFLMQFMVQGAWGVIPAHLNELSPPAVRGTFPGFAYQLGNLLSSRNQVLQAKLAEQRYGGAFAPVLAWTLVLVATLVAVVTGSGRERRGADLSNTN